jgi:hypothetical protein
MSFEGTHTVSATDSAASTADASARLSTEASCGKVVRQPKGACARAYASPRARSAVGVASAHRSSSDTNDVESRGRGERGCRLGDAYAKVTAVRRSQPS